MKKYKLKNGLIVCNKIPINNKINYIKTIISTDEKELIEQFINAIDNIRANNQEMPQIFCFNRNDYFNFILSRALKYTINLQKILMPLNKWQVEDIEDKINCFNNKKELFEYLNLKDINEDLSLNEAKESKESLKRYISNQLNIIENFSIITSKLLDITYQNNLANKIVIYIETEILKDKIEEFKKEYNYVEDKDIERYMKHNFKYSKIVSISICQLTNKLIKGAEEENVV